MGERMRSNRLYMARHVRRYKRRARREAARGAQHPVYPALCVAPQHPVGSPMYEFFNSWPAAVRLRSAERGVRWSLVLHSQHCPFCTRGDKGKGFGRCETLQDFVDHLDVNHPDFVYEPKCERDGTATILVRALCWGLWVDTNALCRFGFVR